MTMTSPSPSRARSASCGAWCRPAPLVVLICSGSWSIIAVRFEFHSLQAGNARCRAGSAALRPESGGRVSKNSAWAIAAFTVERWNGLVIRKVGSGRSPVSSRSGKAVMKITGTLNSAQDVLDRVDARAVVGELDVGEHQARAARHRLLHRLVAGHGDAGDVVAEVADDRLDVHRDDRLVLDDQHLGAGLALDLGQRLGDQRLDLLGRSRRSDSRHPRA